MKAFSLVSTSKGVMAVGGFDYTNLRNKDEILIMKCQGDKDISTCKWEEYWKKLEVARNSHVVIPLPASYEICNDWTSLQILKNGNQNQNFYYVNRTVCKKWAKRAKFIFIARIFEFSGQKFTLK